MATPSITVKGLREVSAKIKRIEDFVDKPSRALLGEIGMFMRFSIQKRTAEGKDVDGQAFKPYTPGYALFRKRTGHPTSPVNLFYTGSMMSSMTYDIGREGKSVLLYFLNTEDESGTRNPAKAFFLNQKRNFFALSDTEVKAIVDITNKYYKRAKKGR